MSDNKKEHREETFDFLGTRKADSDNIYGDATDKSGGIGTDRFGGDDLSDGIQRAAADKTAGKKRQQDINQNRGSSAKPGRTKWNIKLIIVAAAALFTVSAIIISGINTLISPSDPGKNSGADINQSIEAGQSGAPDTTGEGTGEDAPENDEETDITAQAELLKAQYDYDGAEALLKTMPGYENDEKAQALLKEIADIRETLVEQDIYKITHVFFHILCVDPENAFDESKWGKQAGGYNALMTTTDEFEKMISELYEKGYVLVSLHDIAREETAEDGSVKMVKQSIMLPPDKKAFVMSEDDVCYYEYMEGAGFSDKMIVGDDGRPTNHYIDSDGNEYVGEYDIVPILDRFIDEHPDFSYKGHKACLVFTGYNGILGYRTDESYDPSSEYYDSSLEQGHDVEEERKQAVEVLKALDADGYDLGSHSWGHRDMGEIDMTRFKTDCDRWNRNVASLIKEATGSQPDIIIFPRGADIADWHSYTSDNERFNYMYDLGFRYFCNVDNNQYWVQLGDTYLRQGRRALDGYNMWLQISGQKDRLSDLFDDVSYIFNKARPTPVPSY